jgi:hypothetical protein
VPLVEILNLLENSRVTNGMSDLSSPAMGMPGAHRTRRSRGVPLQAEVSRPNGGSPQWPIHDATGRL